MASADPRDIVTRHQVYLERLKSGYINDYGVAIRGADKAIGEVLQALRVESLGELTRKQLQELLTALREAQAAYYAKAMENLTQNFIALAAAETVFEEKLVSTLSQAKLRSVANAYAVALRQPISATGELLEPFLTDLSAREIKRVEDEVMKSLAQGRTISQTVSAVRGTKKNNYLDGVLQRNWTDARTVIRTATQHVSSTSRAALWAANSDIIDSYQIVATLDGKTSQQCKSLDGEVFKLGKGPRPPFHPNCRTTTVPYFGDDTGGTRSSETGYVKGSTTYYEWLKQQPESFQIDALGPTRAKLFRSGGLSAKEFSDLNLGRNFRPLTLSEMQELEPVAFQRAGLPLQPRVSRPRQYGVLTKPDGFTEAWKQADATVNGGPFARSTFDRYIGNTKVSSALRRDFEYANQVSDIQEDVAAMTAVIDSGGLTKDLVVYRGLNAGVLDELKIGDSFTDEAFMSATPYAESPFIKETKKHGGHLMTIRLPQGAKGRYITSPTFDKFYSEEHELLLQRNTTLKVVDTIEHKGYREYVFDYVKSAPEEYNFYNHLTKMSTAEVGKLVSAYYQRRAASGVSMDLLSAEFAKHNFAAKTKEELVAFLRGVQFDPFNPGQ